MIFDKYSITLLKRQITLLALSNLMTKTKMMNVIECKNIKLMQHFTLVTFMRTPTYTQSIWVNE